MTPVITAGDRLGFTLFMALTVHAIVVLGIGFKSSQDQDAEALPSLDIILANSQSFEEVDNPDYLAQVDQAGGGEADDKARPSAPVSSPTPINQQGLADQDLEEMRRQQLQVSKLYFLTRQQADEAVDQTRQQRSEESLSQDPSEAEQRAEKIARLQAEIRQMTIDYARRPKVVTLTASTKKAIEASYLASWVQKIEQTGNLNYPSEARNHDLDGRLRMSVRINAAGEVIDMKITHSSGTSVLDEAARRILRLAEPFAPFSTELRERADQIVIIRTWDFNSNRFKTQSGVS